MFASAAFPGHSISSFSFLYFLLNLPGGDIARANADYVNTVWVLARQMSSVTSQEVPGWNGFISETGVRPAKLTSIDYYPVINKPITEYTTIKECLRVSEQATREVGCQEYVITTFDLGVCMKAYPLIWTKPGYEKHIIMIGSFHLIGAYLKAIGKKMKDSGIHEVLLEAELTTPGSLTGIIDGKNYARAMFCHKTVLEGLERLLLRKFNQNPQGMAAAKMRKLLENRSKENLEEVLQDSAVTKLVDDYEKFKNEVRRGKLGKTAQLWITYMDHIWLVLRLILSVKTNNFELYQACTYQMRGLFFAFNGQNYARYLTFFSTFLANLDESHPGGSDLLRAGAISVARSFVPGIYLFDI